MSEIHPALSAFISARRKYELARTREAGRARQAAKIKELRTVLLALGYETLSQQAAVLGLKRPTVWAMFNSDHTRGGISSNTVRQMLAAKAAPQQLKQVIREYVREKLAGAYGHNQPALRRFRLRAGISADLN